MKRRGALVLVLLALAACATPLPTRYYTLSSELPRPGTATRTTPGSRIAIGPVSVPEALDRQQIVLRVAPNRYAISDADRWAEPLKREIPRVLAQDVGRRLPTADVAAYYQFGAQDAKYRVLIDVLRFESVPGESASLEAAWSVRNRAGARLHEARSVFVEKVNAPGIAPLVVAHDKALAALADEIAKALAALARQGQ